MRLLFLFLCVFVITPARASVVYVDGAAVGTHDGTSWLNAFTTIQEGVDAAAAIGGGDVWIKSGVYSAPTTTIPGDSFEARDSNAVDILGEERDIYYSGGKYVHMTLIYTTGDVFQQPVSASFGNTTRNNSLSERLSAIAAQSPDVLVIINHPTWPGTIIPAADLVAAANANALHVMEISRWSPQEEIDDVAKWDCILASLDDRSSGCNKIVWATRGDDRHEINAANYIYYGAVVGSIPTPSQDAVYTNRRTAFKDMLMRGSYVALPPNSKCGIPGYDLLSSNGTASAFGFSCNVRNIGNATSAALKLYGCDWQTGDSPGTLLFSAPLVLDSPNSVTYYLTQDGTDNGVQLTAEQKANIKYIRPVITWIFNGEPRNAYCQPVRINSSGNWWNGPAYTPASSQLPVGPSPYQSGGQEIFYNTHSHTLVSDGNSTPATMREKYWTNFGQLGGNAPRFTILTDHNVAVPFAKPAQTVVDMKPKVRLYGGFSGSETTVSPRHWNANQTIIDGGGVNRCINIAGYDWNDRQSTVIDGLAIHNGMANGGAGGGLCSWMCDGTVSNCTFTNNKADMGAALYAYNSNMTITGCTFADNNTFPSTYAFGGAILGDNIPSATIKSCTFSNNTAAKGGALVSDCSNIGVHYCKFFNNSAVDPAGVGGAVFIRENTPVISDSIFVKNKAKYGGGIYIANSSSLITNNTIAYNSANLCGGIFCSRATAQITNNIIAFNSSGVYSEVFSPTLTYNNLYGNTPNYFGLAYPGIGSISVDPGFINASQDDYHLQSASLCVEAGTTTAPGISTADMDGSPRIINRYPDLGAFESTVIIRIGKGHLDNDVYTLPPTTITRDFGGYYYVEADDRSFGIRVEQPGHPFGEGQRLAIEGEIRTNGDYERYLLVRSYTPLGSADVKPLFMTIRNLGGADFYYNPATSEGQRGVENGLGLNNIGMLVRVAGIVTTKGNNWFMVSDGSSIEAKVACAGGIIIPDSGTRVIVTGISSCELVDSQVRRRILVRHQADIK